MALVTKAAGASMDAWPFGEAQGFRPADPSLLRPAGFRLGPFIAGEALGNLAPCYIKSDGLVYQSTGAAVNAAAKVNGYCVGGAAIGAQVYLCYEIVAYYGTGLTPGSFVFLGTAAGTLDSAATTGGTGLIGIVLDSQRILLKQSTY
jgi:hypothetical protein